MNVVYSRVSPKFFETLGTLLAGRDSEKNPGLTTGGIQCPLRSSMRPSPKSSSWRKPCRKIPPRLWVQTG